MQRFVQYLTQQRQRDRPFVFERIAIKRRHESGKAAHVARRAGKQVIKCVGRQAQAACRGLRADSFASFGIGQRQQAVNQPGAHTCAQIFAQFELQRWHGGGDEQTAARRAQTIEQIEQRDLPAFAEQADVIDGVKIQRLANRSQLRVDCCVKVPRFAGAQQVRFAGPAITPEEQQGLPVFRQQPPGEPGQGLAIPAGNKVVEAGRGFRQ